MEKIRWWKVLIGIILSFGILVIAQIVSHVIGEGIVAMKMPMAAGNVVAGVVYAVIAFLGIKWMCSKVLRISMSTYRISKFRLNIVWCIVAIVLPAIVIFCYMFVKGSWVISDFTIAEKAALITGSVFYYGLSGGIVEEMVFRGVIMGLLEKCSNIKVAVIVPSVLFGLAHIIGNNLDILSTIQLVIAGTVVGILFSLIAYQGNNIWNSALVHAVWNMTTIGIMHIGIEADSSTIFNYVLKTDSFLITGGDFGIEASVISILAYIIFILLAFILVKKNET